MVDRNEILKKYKNKMDIVQIKSREIKEDTSFLMPAFEAEQRYKEQLERESYPQTVNDIVNESVNNIGESVNETVNKLAVVPQTVNKSVNDIVNESVNAKEMFTFSSLIGLQRKILLFLYWEASNYPDKITSQLSLQYLSDHLKCSHHVVKTLIQRLVIKELLVREFSKNGRGGWTRYKLPSRIFGEIKLQETVNKSVNETVNKDRYSSSSIYINKTTTAFIDPIQKFEELPAAWESIDITPLSEIQFSRSHLVQLHKLGKCEPAVIEHSIYHFAFARLHRAKVRDNPDQLNLLIGVLRKGGGWTEQDCKSPSQLATEEKLAWERKTKEAEEKLITERFELWMNAQSTEQLNSLIDVACRKGQLRRSALLSYYKTNILSRG